MGAPIGWLKVAQHVQHIIGEPVRARSLPVYFDPPANSIRAGFLVGAPQVFKEMRFDRGVIVKKYRNLARCSQQASITRIGQSILWLSKTLDLPDIVCLVLFLPPRVYIGAHRIKCAIIGAIIDDDDFKGIIGQRLSPQAS